MYIAGDLVELLCIYYNLNGWIAKYNMHLITFMESVENDIPVKCKDMNTQHYRDIEQQPKRFH